jgi:hypothetical protein
MFGRSRFDEVFHLEHPKQLPEGGITEAEDQNADLIMLVVPTLFINSARLTGSSWRRILPQFWFFWICLRTSWVDWMMATD